MSKYNTSIVCRDGISFYLNINQTVKQCKKTKILILYEKDNKY
jgi:hypothetical protein